MRKRYISVEIPDGDGGSVRKGVLIEDKEFPNLVYTLATLWSAVPGVEGITKDLEGYTYVPDPGQEMLVSPVKAHMTRAVDCAQAVLQQATALARDGLLAGRPWGEIILKNGPDEDHARWEREDICERLPRAIGGLWDTFKSVAGSLGRDALRTFLPSTASQFLDKPGFEREKPAARPRQDYRRERRNRARSRFAPSARPQDNVSAEVAANTRAIEANAEAIESLRPRRQRQRPRAR